MKTSTRCPKCGKNNYGDMKKCSFCGAPLVFIPGEEVPQVKEEEIQEKLATIKVARIRNPMIIGAGGMVMLIGFLLAVAIYLIVMFLVFTPADIEPKFEYGAFHYRMADNEQYVYAEITAITKAEDVTWEGGNHGYYEMTAYELSGDGVDNRMIAQREGKVEQEPDVWVFSDKDIGKRGDHVLIQVGSKDNDLGEERVVVKGKAGWGGKGFMSGWIFFLPGLLTLVVGGAILAIGLIGKADRSMERLLQEDKELRRQQLMLREAARRQMVEKQKMSQWSDYAAQSKNQVLSSDQAPSGPIPADFAQGPPPSQPQQAPSQAQIPPPSAPPVAPVQQPVQTPAPIQAPPPSQLVQQPVQPPQQYYPQPPQQNPQYPPRSPQ